MYELEDLLSAVRNVPPRPGRRARLLALSGIDASGKGYVSRLLAERLSAGGHRVASISADGWLSSPSVRFGSNNPGLHFYRHALRLDEMFSCLIDPLVRDGTVYLIADFTEETAESYRRHTYSFEAVDTVILEGIFLFRRAFCSAYDLRVWVDCSFETALERAVARSQEALSPQDTVAAYESIYFPAQQVHFDIDLPQYAADVIYVNDQRRKKSTVCPRRP